MLGPPSDRPRKVTAADMVEIRKRVARGESRASVARSLEICSGYVSMLLRNGLGPPKRRGRPARFTASQFAEMRSRAAAGEKLRTLAREFGLSVSYMSRIVAQGTQASERLTSSSRQRKRPALKLRLVPARMNPAGLDGLPE